MSNELGRTIQDLRERAGLTQEQLAERLKLTQQSIAKWESGRAAPRISVLELLAAELGVSRLLLMQARSIDKRGRNVTDVERKPEAEGAQAIANHHIASSDLTIRPPSDFPELTSAMNPLEYFAKLKETIAPALERIHPEGEWQRSIRGNSLAWLVDYMNDVHLVQFVTIQRPALLAVSLQRNIMRELWKMATLRGHLKDSRNYILVITFGSRDTESDMSDPKFHSRGFMADAALRRLMAEAALLDIFVFVARSPAHVVSILDPSSTSLFQDSEEDESGHEVGDM